MIKPILVIAGPTASGKSDLAFKLASQFNGEIINADSRQVYIGMEIGTNSPDQEYFSIIPHHLFSFLKPDEKFNVGLYKPMAIKKIYEVQQKGKLAIIVGGTGQYIWSLLEGWNIPNVSPDLEYRRLLEQKSNTGPNDGLYEELMKIDPGSGLTINRNNKRRIIRALEIFKVTGIPASTLKTKTPPQWKYLLIGLTMERTKLYSASDKQIDNMFNQGWIDEVKALISKGYDWELSSMSSLGFKEIGDYIKGEKSLEETIKMIKTDTHRFIRSQYGWFRLNDKRIHWINHSPTDTSYAINLVRKKLYSKDLN